MGHGRRAAESIEKYLNNEPLENYTTHMVQPEVLRGESFRPHAYAKTYKETSKADRQEVNKLDPEKRKYNYEEVELGYTEEQAVKEASRCLNCGVCVECHECQRVCEPGAVDYSMTDKITDVEKRSFEKKEDFLTFYKRRAKRLLPLYIISGLLFIAFSPIAEKIVHLVSYITLLITVSFPFTKMTFLPKFNPILWAIGIIIWFSLLFPFIVRLSKKRGIGRTFFYSLIMSLVVRSIGVQFHFFDIGNPYVNVLKDSILGRTDDFILRMFICDIYCRDGEKPTRFLSPGIALLGGLLFLFVSSSLWDYVKLGILPAFISPLINNVLQVGLFFLILALLYIKNGIVEFLFSNYFIQLTGMISYSLVIWH